MSQISITVDGKAQQVEADQRPTHLFAENKDVVVTLYDQTRKELATNLDKKSNKILPGLGYKCGATGVYYMSFHLKDASSCGLSVLGFQK